MAELHEDCGGCGGRGTFAVTLTDDDWNQPNEDDVYLCVDCGKLDVRMRRIFWHVRRRVDPSRADELTERLAERILSGGHVPLESELEAVEQRLGIAA